MGFVMFVLLLALVYLTVIKPEHGKLVWAWVKSLFSKGDGPGPLAPALLALMLAASFPLGAQAQTPCLSPEVIAEIAKSRGDKLVLLTPSQVALMAKSYNDTEPKSDEKFDAGYIVKSPRANLVLLMRDGCAEAKAALSDAMIAQILGQDV